MKVNENKLYKKVNSRSYYFIDYADDKYVSVIKTNKNGMLMSQNSDLYTLDYFIENFIETDIEI